MLPENDFFFFYFGTTAYLAQQELPNFLRSPVFGNWNIPIGSRDGKSVQKRRTTIKEEASELNYE